MENPEQLIFDRWLKKHALLYLESGHTSVEDYLDTCKSNLLGAWLSQMFVSTIIQKLEKEIELVK